VVIPNTPHKQLFYQIHSISLRKGHPIKAPKEISFLSFIG